MRLDNDLALEHTVAFAIEHAAEALSTFAATGRVIDDKRIVDMLAAPDQSRSSNAGMRTLSAEPYETLIADDRTAGREREIVIRGASIYRDAHCRDPKRGVAVLPDPDVFDAGTLPDNEFKRRVDLIV